MEPLFRRMRVALFRIVARTGMADAAAVVSGHDVFRLLNVLPSSFLVRFWHVFRVLLLGFFASGYCERGFVPVLACFGSGLYYLFSF